jgi:hypothetical protein
MRKKVIVALVLMVAAVSARASLTITWGVQNNASDPRIYRDSGFTDLLDPAANINNSYDGCFVQLILVGGVSSGSSTPSQATDSGEGTGTSGDTVLATSWIGLGSPTFGSPYQGYFVQDNSGFTSSDIAQNDYVFIRAWNNVSSDGSTVPTTGSGGGAALYGDSPVMQLTVDPDGDGASVEFYVTSNFSTTLTPVPEPTTLMLLGLGMVGLAIRRRVA